MRLQRIIVTLTFAMLWGALSFAGPEWVARVDGVGPAKVDMSLAELNAALGEKFQMPGNKEDRGCFYVTPAGHAHVLLMIENGRLARIDVDGPGIPTSEGVQVGDSEARAVQVYGEKLNVRKSHYGGPRDHNLTVLSADHRYGIRFETTKGKISMLYAGRAKPIQYVEGCE